MLEEHIWYLSAIQYARVTYLIIVLLSILPLSSLSTTKTPTSIIAKESTKIKIKKYGKNKAVPGHIANISFERKIFLIRPVINL